jgi:hypothetical protein
MIPRSIPGGLAALLLATALLPSGAFAQSVCLPAPRLLTVMPMGGQAGGTVEVTLSGQNLEEVSQLLFSTPKITAKPVTGSDGKPVENKFLVSIAPDAPVGVHDARVLSRLGISSVRAFSVSSVPEVTRAKPNNSLETAMPLALNSICNAAMTKRAVDYYTFPGVKGKRVAVDCAAGGIDSKLVPVVIVADAKGRDLVVNRTGGVIDFTPPADGAYVIKLHGLTFQGGPEHFYRLALKEVNGTGPVPRQPSTATVGSFSWPPLGLPATAAAKETEPNNQALQAQKITLPCDITGTFFPAADVDTYEFAAKKGEIWWIETGSERLGMPTDPFVLVQRVVKTDGKETLSDVAELSDLASPMKISTNGYSYDGPPYDAGSPDVLGKVEIKEDGIYRLQVRDLFGGTRNEPSNAYRLIVRKAAPDFALASWAVHFTLRNGDRAALSKPLSLRAGASQAFEVVAVRRDGFDGEISLSMEGLPAGVTASGLRIPAGKAQGMIVVTAAENAAPGFAMAKMVGKAQINGASVARECRLASMKWPVVDAKQEIPGPRLVADIPVSVTQSEKAPLGFGAAEDKVWEGTVGQVLKIPLKASWNSEFAGSSIKLKAYGAGFEAVPEFDLPVKGSTAEATLDLAALKTPPGDYTLAFVGGAVTRYRANPGAVATAEAAQKKADAEAAAVVANAASTPEQKKAAETAKADCAKRLKTATETATPKDTAEIFVSAPIRISVKPAPVTTAAK